ncbi:NAD(P)H-dependent oxidoreductase [Massilia sp. PAMC28688]|uniref:NAD(P)H-dependent oxidoreductase n=1 Tax=Massilia sp. PAMC28688 TaxID=2861283 RepID=UPI001C62650E|nr:NAD(P)H-dependent oxidoreductase [Massilia sp. PAMC28688]QYF94120.1 NAD(P)H-dependent oxidoreductase [Massilia sp. PAMC28688]
MNAVIFKQDNPGAERSRVLLIDGSEQDDSAQREHTVRMVHLSKQLLEESGMEVELLDPALHRSSDVYEKWLFTDGVMIIAPTGSEAIGRQFRPAIDRLAAAGYTAKLADRAYGVVVHGQRDQMPGMREDLTGWLDGMGMVDADSFAALDHHLGYHEGVPGAAQEQHDYEAEVRSVARAVSNAVTELRAGRLTPPERRARAA